MKTALHYTFQPGQVRIIDDLLLAAFGEEHIAKTGTTGKFPAQPAGPAPASARAHQAAQPGEGRFK